MATQAKALEKASESSIDWSSLWKKEDWWAVWIGFVILLLGAAQWLPAPPKIATWTDIGKAFRAGFGTAGQTVILLISILVVTLVAILATRKNARHYLAGFLVVFGLAFLATLIGKFATLSQWGLETVLWALALGLVIGNIRRLPAWLKAAVQTEFYIKIGLVLLGAEILFSTIMKAGVFSMAQALLVVVVVWFFAYWVARRFGLDKSFSSVLASGVSICGVSAAIAAGGAVKGEAKHTSHVISLVLLIAMPMLVGMPLLARALGLPPVMAGAWMGGTIDTTGAVAAAGTLVDPKLGLQVASLVKMSQNVLMGFAAFFLAIWSTFSIARKPVAEKPQLIEIWYRLPKFIIGFVLASLVFSFIVEPSIGAKATSAAIALTSGYRGWFFALAFVSIGLDTRFKALIAEGRGRPLAAFVVAQVGNIAWALVVVWLLWSGTFFAPPIG